MRQAMPEAMPVAMLNECSEQSTQRNATNRRNVRLQDNEENPHFGNRASGAVDKSEAA